MTNDRGAAADAGTPTSDGELSAPTPAAVDKRIGRHPKQEAIGTDFDDTGGFGFESATVAYPVARERWRLDTKQSQTTCLAHHTVSQPNVPATAVDRHEIENTTAKTLDEKDVISSPSVDREVWEVKRDATDDVVCHNGRRDTEFYQNNETADDSRQTDVAPSGDDAQSAVSDAKNAADLMPERKRSYTMSELQEGQTTHLKESAVNTIQSKRTSELRESAVNTSQSTSGVESLECTTSSSSLTTSTPSGKKIPYADDGSVQFVAVSSKPSRENVSVMNDRLERHRPETELWSDDDTDIDVRICDELENAVMASNNVEKDDDTASLMSQLRQLSSFADQKSAQTLTQPVQSSRQPPSEEQTSSLLSQLRQLSSFADQKPAQTLTQPVQSSRQPPSEEQTSSLLSHLRQLSSFADQKPAQTSIPVQSSRQPPSEEQTSSLLSQLRQLSSFADQKSAQILTQPVQSSRQPPSEEQTSLMSQLRQLSSFVDQNPPHQTSTSVQSSRQPPSEDQTSSLMSQLRQLSGIVDKKPPHQTSTTPVQSSRQPPLEERTTDVGRFQKVPTSRTSRLPRGRGRTHDQPTISATTKMAGQFDHNANDLDVDDDDMSTTSLLPLPKHLTGFMDQKPPESSSLPRQLSRVVVQKSPQTLPAAPVQSPPKKSQSEDRTKRTSISQKVETSTTSKPSRGVAGGPIRGKTYDRPTISATAKMAGPVFTWNRPSANDDNDNDDDSVTNEAGGRSAVRATLNKPQLDDILSLDGSVDFDARAAQPETTGSQFRNSSMSASRRQPDTAGRRSRSGRRSVADDILSVDGSLDFDAPAVQPESTGSKVRSSSTSASRRQPDTAGKRSRSGSKSTADLRDNRLKDALNDDLQFFDTDDQVPTRKRCFGREISQLAARLQHTSSEQAMKSSDSRQRGGSQSPSTAGHQRVDGGGQQSVEDVYVEAMSLDAEGRVSGQSSIEWREELARIIDSLRHQLRSREKTVASRKPKICLLTSGDLEEYRNFTLPTVRRKSKR